MTFEHVIDKTELSVLQAYKPVGLSYPRAEHIKRPSQAGYQRKREREREQRRRQLSDPDLVKLRANPISSWEQLQKPVNTNTQSWIDQLGDPLQGGRSSHGLRHGRSKLATLMTSLVVEGESSLLIKCSK